MSMTSPTKFSQITLEMFFEGWSWLNFNNVGLVLDMTLKFYSNLEKGLKLKARKF